MPSTSPILRLGERSSCGRLGETTGRWKSKGCWSWSSGPSVASTATARYDDILRLRTTVVRVTPAKIEHEYRLFRQEELLAVGNVTLAVIDREGKVQRMPENFHTED